MPTLIVWFRCKKLIYRPVLQNWMKIVGYQIFLRITRFVILVIRPDYREFCLRSTPELYSRWGRHVTYTTSLCLSFNQHIPNFIVGIHTMGNRIVVSDIQESFHFVRYRRNENQLIVFADDTTPRWITCSCMLDYNTVAGADKFGNIAIVSSNVVGVFQNCRNIIVCRVFSVPVWLFVMIGCRWFKLVAVLLLFHVLP